MKGVPGVLVDAAASVDRPAHVACGTLDVKDWYTNDGDSSRVCNRMRSHGGNTPAFQAPPVMMTRTFPNITGTSTTFAAWKYARGCDGKKVVPTVGQKGLNVYVTRSVETHANKT